MRAVAARGGNDLLAHRVMATLFYEPSTRRGSRFETAMYRLGGHVITTENAGVLVSHQGRDAGGYGRGWARMRTCW